MPATIHRDQRWAALLQALPVDGKVKEGRTVAELRELVGSAYKDCVSEKAKIRALQRDLKDLLAENEVVTKALPRRGETLFYWRSRNAVPKFRKPNLVGLLDDLLDLSIPEDIARDTVQRVQRPDSLFDLPSTQFVTVSDSVRLTPMADPDATIKGEIIAALRKRRVLKVSYQKLGEDTPSERRLHALGIMQRGPQLYLIAYDEIKLKLPKPPEQMYLLQRFYDALVLDDPVRLPAGADLRELAKQRSLADFVQDPTPVQVKLKVRDYVCRLLAYSRLAPDQTMDATDEDGWAIVTATLPLSGTLYRWVLGFGDKVEVLAPESLRRTVASQAEAVAEIYADPDDEDDSESA